MVPQYQQVARQSVWLAYVDTNACRNLYEWRLYVCKLPHIERWPISCPNGGLLLILNGTYTEEQLYWRLKRWVWR